MRFSTLIHPLAQDIRQQGAKLGATLDSYDYKQCACPAKLGSVVTGATYEWCVHIHPTGRLDGNDLPPWQLCEQFGGV